MKPFDNFNRPIYPKTFQQLTINGDNLKSSGYTESQNKQNLFYKRIDEGSFWADMRGTDQIPIWEDPSALFYFCFNDDIPMWKRRRILQQEVENLNKHSVKARFPTQRHGIPEYNGDQNQDGSKFILEYSNEALGLCQHCGKDIQGQNTFCSTTCEEQYAIINTKPPEPPEYIATCKVCNEDITTYDEYIYHHIKYEPPETVILHLKCHIKIHKTKNHEYQFLIQYTHEEKERFYQQDPESRALIAAQKEEKKQKGIEKQVEHDKNSKIKRQIKYRKKHICLECDVQGVQRQGRYPGSFFWVCPQCNKSC